MGMLKHGRSLNLKTVWLSINKGRQRIIASLERLEPVSSGSAEAFKRGLHRAQADGVRPRATSVLEPGRGSHDPTLDHEMLDYSAVGVGAPTWQSIVIVHVCQCLQPLPPPTRSTRT